MPLRGALTGHTVETAFERGWATLKNGDLLREAEAAEFALLITTDQNLQYQQNLAARRIAILVLTSTSWPRIRSVTAVVAQAVANIAPLGFVVVSIP